MAITIDAYRPDLAREKVAAAMAHMKAQATAAGIQPFVDAGLVVRVCDVGQDAWDNLTEMASQGVNIKTSTALLNGDEITVTPVFKVLRGKRKDDQREIILLMPTTREDLVRVFSATRNPDRGFI